MNLRKLDQKFRRAMAEGVNECTEVLAAKMVENCPEDTGTLKDDIHAHKAKSFKNVIRGNVTVGDNDIDYAVEVEFGSVHNAPQPFARPAHRQTKRKRIGILKNAAKKGLS